MTRREGTEPLIIRVSNFDLDATFGCGQCFRWEKRADGVYEGVAFGRRLAVSQRGDLLALWGTSPSEFESLWRGYFDLDRDYGRIRAELSADPVLERAARFAPGIRILRQEPWEALCTFIISQNNNIPRIRGIVARLCESFGGDLGGVFAFPGPERLAGLETADLAPLRAGFRAKYILDAARKIASGEVELTRLPGLPLEAARAELMKISGVGPKVADCALLFGLGRTDAFPTDVWIRRVLDGFYPDGFPEEHRAYAGIAQQYLFHYARCCPDCGLER